MVLSNVKKYSEKYEVRKYISYAYGVDFGDGISAVSDGF